MQFDCADLNTAISLTDGHRLAYKTLDYSHCLVFRAAKAVFGCGKFSKENENLENAIGSFSIQKFSKK